MRKKLTDIYFPFKKYKHPLKRSMSGFEVEMFVLNNDGSIDNSDALYQAAQQKNLSVQQECAKSMIEVICLPNKKVVSSAESLLKNLAQLSELAEKKDLHLYPFATYLGNNQPIFRKKLWYSIQKKILGSERFDNAGKCCGYHQHYALPRGMFDNKTKSLNYKIDSKVKRTLLDSYNLMVAVDPILTCFMQSSPYTDLNYLAKDSRVLLYRGGSKLKYSDGLYSRRQFFGGLPPYKQTLRDLQSTLRKRHRKWKSLIKKTGHHSNKYLESENILNFTWNPVKINSKGTLEYRGGDMNMTKYILASATMIQTMLQKVQQDFLYVIPMDIDLKDSFKLEGNILFIPPHTLVRNRLQKSSAYEGLENDDVYLYSKRFFSFIEKITPKEYKKLLLPFKRMLSERMTVSDRIIRRVKKKGDLTQKSAQELAIFYSDLFKKDIYNSLDLLHKNDFPM